MTEEEENLALFREEAEDLLSEVTESVLALEAEGTAATKEEHVHLIFRSVHTLKGLAGMCDLAELTGFAHRMESVLEKARSGILHWSSAMTTAMLSALDHLQLLVKVAPKNPKDPRGEQILVALESIASPSPTAAPKTPIPPPSIPAASGPIRLTGVKLALEFCDDSKIVAACKALRALGECTDIALMDCFHVLVAAKTGKTEVDTTLAFLGQEAFSSEEIAVVEPAQMSLIPKLARLMNRGATNLPEAWESLLPKVEKPTEQEAPAPEPEAPPIPQTQKQRPEPEAESRAQAAHGLRISTERLDRLAEVVAEIVVMQAQLTELSTRSPDKRWGQPLEAMGNLVENLRNVTMQIRMMPIANIFRSLTRSVRDLAADLGKEVHFVTSGGETEIDKTVFDRLTNPLLHLVRNSLDHGIDFPDERLRSGKPRCGTLKLHATHQAGQVVLTLSDDGNGVSLEAVQKRATELGFIQPGQVPTSKELHAMVFKPGFSTKTEVTEISGRGVGLDAVKRQVDQLRGSVLLDSIPGHGTTVTLRLPLTLAIIDGLLVEVNEARYVLPLSSVSECFKFAPEEGERFAPMIRLRSEALPYLDVRELFELLPGISNRTGKAVLMEHDSQRFAVIVDKVLGNLQTVVKSIGTLFHRTNLIAGATILGDGGIALILDPAGLAHELKQKTAALPTF